MLSEDPKQYYKALEELKKEQMDKGRLREDHMFEDKYIISERTIYSKALTGGISNQGYGQTIGRYNYNQDEILDEENQMHLEDNESH